MLKRGIDRARGDQRSPSTGRAPSPGGSNQGAARGGGSLVDRGIDEGIKGAVGAATGGVGKALLETELGKKAVRLARRRIKLVIGAPVALLSLIVVAIFGGGLNIALDDGGSVYVVEPPANVDIPPPYLEAYRSFGEQYDIPWTLLAAVGAKATFHGRINPYLQPVPPVSGAFAAGPVSGVYLLGDSLAVGSGPTVSSLGGSGGTTVVVEALQGRPAGQEAADAFAANPAPAGAAVVVVLGTNNGNNPTGFARGIDTVMNAIGPSRVVHWLTVDTRDPANPSAGTTAGAVNAELRNAQGRFPNLRIADWAAYAASAGINPGGDGIHYGPAGYAKMGEYIFGIAGSGGGTPTGPVVPGAALTGPGVMPTPTGACPALPQPVAGPNADQGAGPLMLSANAIARETGNQVSVSELQNICRSVEILAVYLKGLAQTLADERDIPYPNGLANLAKEASEGNSEAAQKTRDFWAEVLNRAKILTNAATSACTMPPQGSQVVDLWVGGAIESLWSCELAQASLSSVGSVSVGAGGIPVIGTLDPLAAVERATSEALTVAWLWSRWGTAACDPTAPGAAGIFPLTQTTFEAHRPTTLTGRDRCDPEANIRAAAATFIAGETPRAETRGGGWDAAVGGWGGFDNVAGDPATRELFRQTGPWAPLLVGELCLNSAFFTLLDLATTTTVFGSASARTVQGYTTAPPDPATRSGLRTELDRIIPTISGDPRCAQPRSYSAGEWLSRLYTAYISDPAGSPSAAPPPGAATPIEGGMTEIPVDSGTTTGPVRSRPPLTTVNLDALAGVGDKMAALAAEAGRAGDSVSVPAAVGSTALLQRLSPVQLLDADRPTLPGSVASGIGAGQQYVNIAQVYGGLFVGDTGSGGVGGGMGNVGPPVPYAEIFNSVGAQYGVDPRVLAAIAKMESNFNPEANCPTAGPAFGMMQLEGGSHVCGNVTLQVETAAQMIKALYDAAGGDWRGAFWGYNNGILFAKAWSTNNGFGGDYSIGGPAYAYARDHYCADPARRARRTETGQSWCEWRAEIAVKYVSGEPGTRSGYTMYLEYQQLFPAAAYGGVSSGMVIDVTRTGGEPQLVRVEGFTVNVQIANQFASMVRAARAAGFDLRGGAYRSYDAQVALRRAHCGTSQYAIYEMPAKECDPPTAPPGKSNHEQGLAADFMYQGAHLGSRTNPAFLWLAANAASYGFYNYPVEPWHWSVDGR